MKNKIKNILDNIKLSEMELLILGTGGIFGIFDGLKNPYMNNLEYFTNGLPLALPAFLVSYGLYGNFKISSELGIALYISGLLGQTLTNLLK